MPRDRSESEQLYWRQYPDTAGEVVTLTLVWLLLVTVGSIPLFWFGGAVSRTVGVSESLLSISLLAVIAFGSLPVAGRLTEFLFD
ncbi:MAG: hypothetical protein ABEI99_04600 [Halobaculum sp.]